MRFDLKRAHVTRRFFMGGILATACAPAVAQDTSGDAVAKIVVPEEHAKLGRVYYLVPTKKPQVTFRSKTKVEKFQGKSSQLAGYLVAAEGDDASPAQLLAGEFRLPVVSFDTDNPSRNDHLGGKRWLNKAAYPEIVFTVSGVTDLKAGKERRGTTSYRAILVGTISLVGQEKELSVKTNIRLKPESEKTRRIAPGDLMTLRTSFDIVLSEYGIGIGDQAIERGRVAAKIKITVNLTLSTKPPEEES